MASALGSAVVIRWMWGSTGTILLNTDYQSFDYSPSIEQLDDTAGNDTARTYIQGFKSGVANYSGYLQQGSAPTWGSALIEGQVGTLEWNPEGTAAGKIKQTIPAFCTSGFKTSAPFDRQISVSLSWQQNGSRTDGTN